MSCINPILLKDLNQYVPCGKCQPCLKRNAQSWAFRLMVEEKKSFYSLFVTLTYSNENVPVCKNGMTLNKKDVQKFFKRLRKNNPGISLKYFVVGEYGTKTWRPHYHFLIFLNRRLFFNDILKAWSLDGKEIGNIHIGYVSGNSVMYTLKYMMKSKRVPAYKDDVRVPEFRTMSKGVGIDYLTRAMISYHKNNLFEKFYCTNKGGFIIPMPRYFRDKIYTAEEKLKLNEYFNDLKSDEPEYLDLKEQHNKLQRLLLDFKLRSSKNFIDNSIF